MANFALISTVTPGPVIKRQAFASAPELAEAKGLKWIADNPPSFDPAIETQAANASIPVDATEVPYTNTAIPLSTLKAAKKAQIDAQRDALLAAGKSVLGSTMDGRLTTMGAIVAKRDRVERGGGAAVKSITGIVKATGVITVTGGAPNNSLEVQFASVGGMTELNGNVYFTSDKSGNNFKIKDRLGNYINMSGFGTYTSGGTVTVVATTIDVSNNLVALDYDAFTTLSDTLSAWHNAMYEQGRAHKNAVDALSDASEINSYDFTSWPT